MSQSFWESDVAEQPQTEHPATESHEPSVALALSTDEFAALEERIVRAVNLVKSERQARAAAEQRVAKLEAQLLEQAPVVNRLEEEVRALNAERDQVRQRVERLLSQLDALEL